MASRSVAVSENDAGQDSLQHDEANTLHARPLKIPNPDEKEAACAQDDSESLQEEAPPDNPIPDDSDARWLGFGRSMEDIRPQAVMSVGRDAQSYKMDHKRRGKTIIFAHDTFDDRNLSSRACAKHDTAITRHTFEYLGFEVMEHWNLTRCIFLQTLVEVSKQDHLNSDCLVVVFMSHGNVSNNKEFLCTRDSKVDTEELWKNFTADKCPSLAGKPKLFFIQACRGDKIDKGVEMKRPKGLRVQTDSFPLSKEDYVIPLHGDMLMMWASYPGMFAFKSYQKDIRGSVLIHFLTKVLLQDGRTCDIFTLLLRVTREVATQYESYTPQSDLLHQNKQTPYMVSTLMRNMSFPVGKL